MNGIIEATIKAESGSLLQVIKNLKSRFFTLEEFPLLSRDVLPGDILSQARNIPESEIRTYAFSLKGRELEGLILDLRDASDELMIRRGCQVLTLRATTRIIKLLTILFQYNYEAPGLQAALRSMADKLKSKETCSLEEAFIWHLGLEEDRLSALCKIIDKQEKNIQTCFKILNISDKSPLAKEAAYRYVIHTTKEGLQINQRWISSSLKVREPREIKDLIQNYLSTFTIYEYSDVINLEIQCKLGKPNNSQEWEFYHPELRVKFTQWHYLYRLRVHSMYHPKKFVILSNYYSQVLNSYEIKDQDLMVIDFGDIVLADITGNPYSFFYEKVAFENEMRDWNQSKAAAENRDPDSDTEQPEIQIPTFLRTDKKSLTARDFIIDEEEEPCVKLSYEGIDVLYIHEMLDIKMGLEPDMRRKQLAKLKSKNA